MRRGCRDSAAAIRRSVAILASRGWRSRGYDLAINFEPDIRSNGIAAAAGARRTAGYRSGGGGALLDVAIDFDPSIHVADNARRLVRATLGRDGAPAAIAPLRLPDASRQQAAALLDRVPAGPRIGIHVAAGRAVKQWPETRFGDVGAFLVRERSAVIVLSGAAEDRAQLDVVRARHAGRRGRRSPPICRC